MPPDAPPIVPDERSLTIFVDGSSLPSPRRGGIGIRFVHSDDVGNETVWDLKERGVAGATNNQMELLALISALKEVQSRRFPDGVLGQVRKIDIYTDSRYVADNVGNALFAWPRNNWHTSDGKPVLNARLWKDLVRELQKARKLKRIEVRWGKGHSASNPHNKAVDKLAKASAKGPLRPPLTPQLVRRKKTKEITELGSVRTRGQRLTIRILQAEYLDVQKVHRYRYEVMSKKSEFFGRVDFAFSDDVLMRPGRTYYVTMGKDPSYPIIAKRHREITR